MNHRTALLAALEAVTAARRDYQVDLDTHLSAQLAAGPSTDAQDEQSLASIVRLLGEASKAIRDAVHCGDQLTVRVNAR